MAKAKKSSKKAPAFDPTQPALAQLRFKADHRCFKKGKTINFRQGVNLLVGEQGCGKSTVLTLVSEFGHRLYRERAAEVAALKGQEVRLATFDFEKSNPRTQSHFGDNAGFQVSAMFSSHGETVKSMLAGFRAEFVDGDPGPTVLLLDEPDMALSPRSARLLARTLDDIAAAGHQVIAAVHNPLVIASQPQVLSLEHGRWLKSETFLAKHATEESQVKDGFGKGGPKQQAVNVG